MNLSTVQIYILIYNESVQGLAGETLYKSNCTNLTTDL